MGTPVGVKVELAIAAGGEVLLGATVEVGSIVGETDGGEVGNGVKVADCAKAGAVVSVMMDNG